MGTHSVMRSGAPPIRITGQRVYHCTRGDGLTGHFISLWTMRGAGLLLAHSLPDQGTDMRCAQKTASLGDATKRLETYCDGLLDIEAKPSAVGGHWDDALEAMMFNNRIEMFRILVGHVLAEWHDWHDPSVVAEIA